MTHATYYTGDVLQVLGRLEPGSVDLVLTSPPFLALRSYLPADHPDKALEGGQEKTPGEFIDWLLDAVEACDRVLAPHGSMCFELGDTFSGSGGGGGDYLPGGWREGQQVYGQGDSHDADCDTDLDCSCYAKRMKASNAAHWRLKNENRDAWPADKSLALIPETFRFALAYGFNPHTGRTTKPWRVRNVVRWVRPNPPVGALGDKFRPGTSEMVVFCRTDEAGRRRYFDLDAVREPHAEHTLKYPRNASHYSNSGYDVDSRADGGRIGSNGGNPAGAPPLDWWEIPTHPYKGAHYATWPPAICIKPIKAMTPEKVCVTCGKASRRVVESEQVARGPQGSNDDLAASLRDRRNLRAPNRLRAVTAESWTDCGHDTWRPGTVLDPFAGSGTTLAVAVGHGRNAIGIDLDERNVELARDRIGPMFFTHEPKRGAA